MSSYKPTDDRQILNRSILQELFPWVGSQTLDVLMTSINADLTPPFKIDATSSPSLVINVGPAIVPNSASGRNKSANFIGTALPVFVSGTVTFPSANGGTISTSTGQTYTLTLPSGDYAQALLSIDESNNLLVTMGGANAVEADALVPAPLADTQPFGYVTLQNIGGVVQNIVQSVIYQLVGGGGGAGGSGGGTAEEVALTIGTTSITVTFPEAQSSSNYAIVSSIYNPTDVNPEFFPVTVTNKTTVGATFSWNQALPTSHYFLDYMIPPGIISEMAGEAVLPNGASSIVITFPLAFLSTAYVVVAELVNLVDGLPMFQPVTITNKTDSTFTAAWNVGVADGNYRLAWSVAAYQ